MGGIRNGVETTFSSCSRRPHVSLHPSFSECFSLRPPQIQRRTNLTIGLYLACPHQQRSSVLNKLAITRGDPGAERRYGATVHLPLSPHGVENVERVRPLPPAGADDSDLQDSQVRGQPAPVRVGCRRSLQPQEKETSEGESSQQPLQQRALIREVSVLIARSAELNAG